MAKLSDSQRLKMLKKAVEQLEMTNEGWKQAQGHLNDHGHWKTAKQLLHALEIDLAPAPKPPPKKAPALGPVFVRDKSILMYPPTHHTSGLPLYSAFDGGWVEGKNVIAPEPVRVTRHSGNSNSGYSLYATGESGLKYYFQHMESAERAAVGSKVAKGGKIGVIGDFVGARVPHLHLGINIEALAGSGKQLKYGNPELPIERRDYTLGAPLIGKQLAAI
jgi:hypothetical protein